MPSKRTASQSSSARAPKRIQLDVNDDSEGDAPPVTPTPPKFRKALSSPAKKVRVATARLRDSLADGLYDVSAVGGYLLCVYSDTYLPDLGCIQNLPLIKIFSAAAAANPTTPKPKKKMEVDDQDKVIELSDDHEDATPVPKRSVAKHPQPKRVRPTANNDEGEEPRTPVPKSTKKARTKATDAEPRAEEEPSTPVQRKSAMRKSDVRPANPVATIESPVKSTSKKSTTQSFAGSAEGKPVKKPVTKAPKSIDKPQHIEDEDTEDDLPAREARTIKPQRLRSPVELSNDQGNGTGSLFDLEAEEEDEGNASQPPEAGDSEDVGDDSFINDAVDGNNDPVESDGEESVPEDEAVEQDDNESVSGDVVVEANSDDSADESRRGDPKGKRKYISPGPEDVEDQADSDVSANESRRRIRRGYAKGKRKYVSPEPEDVDEGDGDDSADESRRRVLHGKAKGKQKNVSPEPEESSLPPLTQQAPVPPTVAVNPNLRPDIQHPDFVEYYATLGPPTLPSTVARMHPYGWTTAQRDEEIEGLEVQAVIDGCQADEATRFRRSVPFAQYQNVFQPGRCDLRQFSYERDCIRIRLDNGRGALSSVAVWVTTGIVNRSYVEFPYTPRSTQGDTRDARTYKIVIMPTISWTLSLVIYSGSTTSSVPFGKVLCLFSHRNRFPTAKTMCILDTHRSPRKSAFTKKKSVPAKPVPAQSSSSQAGSSSSGGNFLHSLPPNRSFEDRIPVYDGRRIPSLTLKGFGWKERDWESLPSLPHYEQEVEEDALVTVGYTVSGWRPCNSVQSVMFNALFVIVLANPHAPV
ncbi:hypothetical protein V5O48_005250 [Marasmius crinis-equi]|uniref:Uncharacterized protein n=1 Tax=Marasmius crinis-equi TaxID=585013 RepID=A0ABR3FNR3_9AGAR